MNLYNQKYRKSLFFILYSIVIIETIRILASSGKVPMGGSTYLLASLEYLSLFILVKIAMATKLGTEVPFKIKLCYLAWLVINMINFLRGIVLATGYWDYKFLFLTSFSFSVISLIFYVGVNHSYFIILCREFFFRIIGTALLITPFVYFYNHELFSRLVIPITFFLCLLPYVNKGTKKILFVTAVISTFIALDFRTNLIKMGMAFSVLILYGLAKRINQRLFNLVHKLLFIIPILLLILGLFTSFNFFSYLSQNDWGTAIDSSGREISMSGDTRTFLYREVISSVMDSGHWLLGESSSGSYRSIFFFDTGGAMNGRRSLSEVGILNIFLYHGIIGVIVYCLLLYFVSSTAISNSNNYLSKMFGIVIASRWLFSFIEEFTLFDMNFFFFWLIMGYVSTNSFRSMTDREVALFFQNGLKKPVAVKRFMARLVGRG